MATEIGIITALVGTATATATDGTIRNLQVGDKVYQNDLITTGAAGAVEVEFADGSTMDMGRSSQAMLDLEVFDPSTAATETAETTETTDDIAAIQQALLEGEDPTVAGEATAAGAGAGGGSEGGHDFVVRDYLNPEVTPENGFDTNGPGNAFLQFEEELNLIEDNGLPTAGDITIELDEDDLSGEQIGQLIESLDSTLAEFLLSFEIGIPSPQESEASLVFQPQLLFSFANGNNDNGPGDDGPTNSPVVKSGTLAFSYGSDGPAATDPLVFNATSGSEVTDADGNLVTSGGQQVYYWVSADGLTVIGYTNPSFGENFPSEFSQGDDNNGQLNGDFIPSFGPQIIFTAQIDSATSGDVTTAIWGPVDHQNSEGVDNFEDNLFINLGFTVTDGNGDATSGNLQLDIDDDTPVIDKATTNSIDETDVDNNGFDVKSVSGDLLFNPGADGAEVTSVDISLTADFRGLTSDGEAVVIADSDNPNEVLVTTEDGDDVFSLVVQPDGSYEFTQYRQLDHVGRDEALIKLGFGYVVTDGDGDTADGLLVISVNDDEPSVDKATTNSIDETDVDNNGFDVKSVSGDLLFNPGADGAEVTSVDISLTADFRGLTSDGEAVVIADSDNPNEVLVTTEDGDDVFSLVVQPDGSYEFTQYRQLDHVGRDEALIKLGFGYVVTDGDGDTANGSLVITVNDDEPTATNETVSVTVDEDDIRTELSSGNEPYDNDGDGSYTGEPNDFIGDTLNFLNGGGPATTTGSVASLVNFGADAEGSFSLADDFSGLESQSLTSKGEELNYEVQGETLIALAGDRTVFTLQLDDNGDFTLQLFDQLDHALGDGENNLSLDLSSVINATDGDNDTITLDSGFTVNVTDDVPEEADILPDAGFVEEEALPNGNQEENDGSFLGFPIDGWPDTAIATGSLQDQVSVGADDSATFSFAEVLSGLPELTSNEAPVNYEVDGDTLTAFTDSGDVFTLKLENNGNYTFTLMGALDHASGQGENILVIDFSSIIEASDFDGDSIILDNDFFITIVDDIPTVGENATVQLDDDALDGGNPGGIGDDADAVNVSGTLTHSFGADGAGNISWLTSGAPAGFAYEQSDSSLLIKQGTTTVLTLTLDSDTGEYTVTQNAPVQHADGQDENNQSFNVEYKVTDADNDSAKGSITINVDDDTPEIVAQDIQILSESFENFAPDLIGNNFTVVGEDSQIIGNNGIVWNLNAAGIEIQSGNVGDSEASDGNVHAELDTDNNSTLLTQLSTDVELPSSEVTLSFDYKARPGNEADSDMQVSLGGQSVTIDADSNGDINFIGLPEGVTANQETNPATDWITITLTYSGLSTASAQTLTFQGLGNANEFGAYLDNINMSADTLGLTVDESDLATDATADFSQFFADSFSYGADGAGDIDYSLSLNDGETGIVDTATNEAVILEMNGGVVEGRTENSDELVFTLSVNDEGVATLDQLRAVKHADTSNPNDVVSLNTGLIDLNATISDADGDEATASVDASGAIIFKDDGPSIGVQEDNEVDEGETTTGTLVFDAGQDGGGISHIDGKPLTFDEVDGYSDDIKLEHGTIKVKADGQYSYTVDSGAVEQDEVENFNFTVTDGDGDTAQGQVAIDIVNAQVNAVITLEDVNVEEGTGPATINASVDNEVTGSDLIINLNNGQGTTVSITIPVGSTTGSGTLNIQGDDPYIDAESFEFVVDSVEGGNFSDIDATDTATVNITDTIDTVTVVLTATESTSEDGGEITYTATILDADNNPVNTLTGVTVELDNGETIIIDEDSSSNSITVPVERDDVYIEDDSSTTAIEDVTETDAGEENAFEDLQFNGDDVTTEITDDKDAVTVKLTATESTSEDGGSITYTASLEDAEGNPVTTNNAITVVLVNDEVITINANSSEGSVTIDVNRDDVFAEDDAISNAIDSVDEANEGEVDAFENLQADETEVSTDINDDTDTVTATLTASPAELSEDGGDITYTITLSGGPGAIDPDSDLVFNLANGEQVTVQAGDVTGSYTRTYTDGEVTNQVSISNSIAGIASGGSEYEDLQTAGTTTVDVDYAPEITNLTPEAQGGDAIVDEDDLAADRDTGESAGTDGSDSTTVQGSFNISAADGIGNLVVGPYAVITNGVFNEGSFTTLMGNTLNFTGYNPTTGEVSYEYTLNDNTLDHGFANNGENNVFEDFDVLLTDADGDEATDTLSVQIVDDVPEIAPLTFGTIEDGQTLSDISLESLFGADGAGDIAFDPALHDSAVLQNGEQVFFDGEALTWSLNGDVLTATTGSDVDAITITLNDADGNYDISVAEGTFYLEGDQQTFAIGDLSGSNALAWVGQSDGIDTLIISEGTSTNTSNAGGTGYVGAGSQWIDAGTADSTTFYFYDSIDAETGALSDQAELDAALDNSVVAGVNSFSISVNTQGGNATTLQLAFVAVDGTLGSASVEIPAGNNPSNPFLLEMDSSDITWEGGQSGLAIASVEFPASDVDYRVGGDLVFNEITPTDIELDLPVTITDADGDVDDGNITGTITSEGVVNPLALSEIPDELYVGTKTDNVDDDNTWTTMGGNDVLIGDQGGREQQFNPGKDYSIALIADESGSMAGGRNELLKEALESFVNDLADHDGVINIALIGFGPGANLEISVEDLTAENGLDDLLAEIDDLAASGGTNYEAAFEQAVEWFQGQPEGHEFISYFMTDGDPTLYGNDQGPGDETDYETFLAAVEAFEALSLISEVNGIGIGNGVNEDYLRFFDNTNNNGTGTEVFGLNTVTLGDFNGEINDPLDGGWTTVGDSNGSAGRNFGDFFTVNDSRSSTAATTAISAAFMVTVADSVLAFDYRTFNTSGNDEFSWGLQRQNENGTWTTVETEELDRDGNWSQVTSNALDIGTYRVLYTGQDNSPQGDSDLDIDNIELRVPEAVTGSVGQPQIINSAGELIAELQEGNTTDTPVDLGDDVLEGGDGDDVIFGDTIFTDDLTWTNGDGEEIEAGHGLGYEGLVEYLTWSEAYGNGTAPTEAEIMQYIRENYESLINPNPSQAEIDAAGDNTLIGGAGNDILIGGEGEDIFQWNEGDDGTTDAPAVDYVVDFDAGEGDVLDVSDLLNTADVSDNLDDYLVANYDSEEDQTTIDVYTNGDAQSGSAQPTQSIVVNGQYEQQDLATLVSNNNLNVDQS